MKAKPLPTVLLILLSLHSFSQQTNELRLFYGISDSKLLRNSDVIGGGSTTVDNFYELGFRYIKKVNANLALETGVSYASADLWTPPTSFPDPSWTIGAQKFESISVPLFGNYTFLKALFINGGPMLDFQISENSIDSQSGVGYGLGIGGKLNWNNFMIFVNPNFKRHAVIPFNKEQYHQKMTEFGLQFGVGYTF